MKKYAYDEDAVNTIIEETADEEFEEVKEEPSKIPY
jgi:hypothetical protein